MADLENVPLVEKVLREESLSDDELLARYAEWRATPSPPTAISGYLYKKAGGHSSSISSSPRHNWSRRYFRLDKKKLSYGTQMDRMREHQQDEDSDDGITVWTGDLSTAKVLSHFLSFWFMNGGCRAPKGRTPNFPQPALVFHFFVRVCGRHTLMGCSCAISN